MNETYKNIKNRISTVVYSLATYISPVFNTQLRFIYITGKKANLRNPQTFSEKLSWLKLNVYANDALVKKCADKYRVRDYIKDCGLEEILNPLYGVYKNTDEIKWDYLPDKFILKWNYGCGYNVICENKANLKWTEVKKKLDKWRKNAYWPKYAEKQYDIEEKVITCERYMESQHEYGLLDYKFYCFHGKVRAILVISRVDTDDNKAVFMTPGWEVLSDIPARYKKTIIPDKPVCLDKMIEVAEILSKPFPFVRVDLFEYESKPILGEMTFTPATGILPSEADIDGKPMGDYINLDSFINH